MTPPTGNEPLWWIVYAFIAVPIVGFLGTKVWPWVTSQIKADRLAAIERDKQVIQMMMSSLADIKLIMEQQTVAINRLSQMIDELRLEIRVEKRVIDHQMRLDSEIERLLNIMAQQIMHSNSAEG